MYRIRHYGIWIVSALMAAQMVSADVVVLRQGKTLHGDVLVQNDEVIVLRTKDGSRYQYPTTEVSAITLECDTLSHDLNATDHIDNHSKRVALLADISGLGVILPYSKGGGALHLDLGLGSHTISQKRLFIGAGTGFHSYWVNEGANYQFIPIQFVARLPLTTKTNAPFAGMNMGYAFCVSKNANHGMCAGIDMGWWHRINEQSSTLLSAHVGWQQTSFAIRETILEQTYTHYSGRDLVTIGIKIAIQF